MAAYRARMIDAATAGEAVYDFEARDDLLSDTPVRVVRAFFEGVDPAVFPTRHVDWEINAALKNAERGVVTVAGALHLKDAPPVPFAVMIARKAEG